MQISLTAWDQAGQASAEALGEGILPTRRFFDPLAASVVDVRRELLWNRKNADRAAHVLRAVSYQPEELFHDMMVYGRLRAAIARIEDKLETLNDAELDALAKELWEIAILIEDGELKEALERLRRAQERLQQAMRDGANPDEIARLMQELREATRDYMRQLAERERQQNEGVDQPDSGQSEQRQMTEDQIQQLMDRIQELMEQGRMAEAQALLEQLNELLENMRVTEGEGSGGEGDQAGEGLQDMLREQQQLNDDTFSELQQQFGQNQQGQQGQQGQPGQQNSPGQQGALGENQPGQERPGQDGQQPGGAAPQEGPQEGSGPEDAPGAGTEERSLAERQEALREALRDQRQQMPGAGGGEETDEALEQADRAMRDAEERLEDGDLSGALSRQAEAMESLREGLRALGRERQAQQQGEQGSEGGGEAGQAQRGDDPLGRSSGDFGEYGSDNEVYEGENAYRRAEELSDEIKKRSAQQEREAEERDYLNRLLDRF